MGRRENSRMDFLSSSCRSSARASCGLCRAGFVAAIGAAVALLLLLLLLLLGGVCLGKQTHGR
jgi:hypothetical protein